MMPQQRSSIENGIWLCQNCSKLIDSDEHRFPTELLRLWKQTAESEALTELRGARLRDVCADSGGMHRLAGWEVVSFASQRSIRFAMAGHGLTEHDVDACPEFAEAKYVVQLLQERRIASIAGGSGSGKSITALHAARQLAAEGWRVLRPAEAGAVSADCVCGLEFAEKTLLLVDNCQALPSPAARLLESLPRDNVAVLMVTAINDALPRHAVVISARGAVEALARAAMDRLDSWYPVLTELDTQIGDERFDVSYRARIQEAAKADSAAGFFFVARGGWSAARRDLASLRSRDRADLLVFAVAIGQLAFLDGHIPDAWITKAMGLLGKSDVWRRRAEDITVAAGALVREPTLRCPHIAYATRTVRVVLGNVPDTNELGLARLLRAAMEPGVAPMRGLSWLLQEARFTDAWWSIAHEAMTDDVWASLCEMVVASEAGQDRCDALFALDAATGWRQRKGSDLAPLLPWLGACINSADATTAYALGQLVNTLINDDKPLRERLCDHISPTAVVDRFLEAAIDTWYEWGYLLGRLVTYAPVPWIDFLGVELKRARIPERATRVSADSLEPLAEVIGNLGAIDLTLCLEAVRATIPKVAAMISESPVRAFQDARALMWNGLGYPPHFLRHNGPTVEQRAVARELVEALDIPCVARSISSSAYRDWNTASALLIFVHEASPATSRQLIAAVSIDELDARVKGRWKRPGPDLLQMVAAMSTDGGVAAVQEWLDRHASEMDEISTIVAMLHPVLAASKLEAGTAFNPRAEGGTHWPRIAHSVRRVAAVNASAACIIARSCAADMAESLSHMERHDIDGMGRVLTAIRGVAPELLSEVISKIDVAKAQVQWNARVAGEAASRSILLLLAPSLPSDHALRILADALLSDANDHGRSVCS